MNLKNTQIEESVGTMLRAASAPGACSDRDYCANMNK